MDTAEDTIHAFIDQNPLLRSLYLVERSGEATSELADIEGHRAFASWFLVYGRHRYRGPVAISEGLVAALTRTDEEGCHGLMRLIARQEGLSRPASALRAWYYRDAVPRHRLGPMIGREELRRLGTSCAQIVDRRAAPIITSMRTTEEPTPPTSPDFLPRLCDLARGARGGGALPSVSIVGFHRSVLGLGEDARCLFECLCRIGVGAELVDVSPPALSTLDRRGSYEAFEAPRPTGSVVVFCLPAMGMMQALAETGFALDRARQHVVGYWPWETSTLPSEWRHAYDAVDEVWASSRFLETVYRAQTSKPVVHMPLHVRIVPPIAMAEIQDVFDGAFTFLSVFDFFSRIERKNPAGTITAFRRAFPAGDEPVRLVLKTINGERRPQDFEAIRRLTRGDRRIIIVDGAITTAELCGLIDQADAYVSLHRAEGFGRPLVEAMLLGTPVIGTQWSGSADYLSEGTGYPVRSSLRPVGRHEYPFAAGEWADPEIDHASALMRTAFRDRAGSRLRSERARRDAEAAFGLDAVASKVRDRLLAIAELPRSV